MVAATGKWDGRSIGASRRRVGYKEVAGAPYGVAGRQGNWVAVLGAIARCLDVVIAEAVTTG